LYIQLSTPDGLLDTHSQLGADADGKLRSTLWKGRSEFLEAALRLLVSCHAVVWVHGDCRLTTSLLEQLKILQAKPFIILTSEAGDE
jgi:hypothetical protein